MDRAVYVPLIWFIAASCARGGAPSQPSPEAPVESTSGAESAGGDELTTAAPAEPSGPPRFQNPTQRCRIEPDYNRCIVYQLDGRAETEGEWIALIQSQRILGDADGAMQNMELFVERFPDSPQAATYREYLESTAAR